MGAGNSSFTPEQVREISKGMKAEYEACKSKGLSSTEEKDYMLKKYEALTKTTNESQAKVVVANARRLTRGFSKDEHGIQQGKTTRGRRRSFDNKPSPTKKSKDMQQSTSTPSLEAKVLEEPPPQGSSMKYSPHFPLSVDTWDSVNGQPSCLICSMVFATPQKLETHTKYSVKFYL